MKNARILACTADCISCPINHDKWPVDPFRVAPEIHQRRRVALESYTASSFPHCRLVDVRSNILPVCFC